MLIQRLQVAYNGSTLNVAFLKFIGGIDAWDKTKHDHGATLAVWLVRIDEISRTLTVNDKPVKLESKPLDVLTILLERPTETVSKEELLEAIWGSTSEQSLAWLFPNSAGPSEENGTRSF